MASGSARIWVTAVLLAVAGCNSSAQKAEKAAARYDAAYARGDYFAARIEISKAIAQQDDVPLYWDKLARVHLVLDRPFDAYEAYSHVIELDKHNSDAIQALAELSYSAGTFDEAEKFADQILADKPTSLRMLLVKGSVAATRNDLAEARAIADKMLAIDPGNEGATILLARLLNAGRRPDLAIATLEKSIARDGDSLTKRMVLLDLYLARDDFPQVARSYARLFALSPDAADFRLDYARLLYEHGRPDRALDMLARLARRHPGDQALRQRIVDIWTDVGGAAVDVDRVRRYVSHGGDEQMKVALGQLLLDERRYAEAEAVLRPLIDGGQISAARVDADVLYAGALSGLGRGAAALALIDRVLAFDASNAGALLMRVRISIAAGDLTKAQRDAQLLVRDNPQMAEGRVALARVFVRRGEKILADDSYAQAMKDLPGDEHMLEAYLDYLLATGRQPMALDVARRFTTGNQRSRDGWRQRAALCIRAGDDLCVAEAFNALDQISGGPKVRRQLERGRAAERGIVRPVSKGAAGKAVTGQGATPCGRTGAPC